jgi:hypothetical protein
MEASHFDETRFFVAITASGARAVLIGRRALVALGLPLLRESTIFGFMATTSPSSMRRAIFNAAMTDFDLFPNRTPEEALATGRYVLENDEKVDVLVARTVFTVDRVRVAFEDIWTQCQIIEIAPSAKIAIPSLENLILTKRFSSRPKDAEDIRMLEALRSREST